MSRRVTGKLNRVQSDGRSVVIKIHPRNDTLPPPIERKEFRKEAAIFEQFVDAAGGVHAKPFVSVDGLRANLGKMTDEGAETVEDGHSVVDLDPAEAVCAVHEDHVGSSVDDCTRECANRGFR